MKQSPHSPGVDPARVLHQGMRGFWGVAVFSGVVNVLMLAGPLYMLQIYDRVLASRSVPTLVALTVFLVGAYALQGILDVIRGKIVVRSASALDQQLGTVIHDIVVRMSVRNRLPGEAMQPLRDLDQIRGFLSGTGPIAIVDLPWMPVFLVITFLIHPWLGALSALGVVILLTLAIQTERMSRQPIREMTAEAGKRAAFMEADRRNSETLIAMGMADNAAKRWATLNEKYVVTSTRSSDVINLYGSATKVLRFILQSAILGLGAYLVLRQELTPGAMIAASIMMGRALAPIEMAIGNWRAFIGARDSRRRLTEMLRRFAQASDVTALPPPERSLEVRQLMVVSPGSQTPIAANVNFDLASGEALGVIGPSASGKSSLIRTLVGVWPPARGTLRLDGATLDQWEAVARGKFIGYVSQSIELMDDTVAANIARMAPNPDSEAVIAAARAAGAHDMILKLPGGYDTPIGEAGLALSAGQRQRVALARALYGDPFMVVLDEPNSNLDREGEEALQLAIRNLKARKAIVVLIAHRPASLANCDKILVLVNGVQQAFGPRDEVLQKFFAVPGRPQQPPAPAAPYAQPTVGVNLKVVGEGTGGSNP